MTKFILAALGAALALAGCAAPTGARVVAAPARTLAVLSLKPASVTLADLVSPAWDRPAKRGARVTFTARLAPETYGGPDQATCQGWRWVDAEGHAVRLDGVYTARRFGLPAGGRDWTPEAAKALLAAPVVVEGRFVPSHSEPRQSAVVQHPPAIAATRVDGRPLDAWLLAAPGR